MTEDQVERVELLPCPFCGDEPRMDRVSPLSRLYAVFCMTCEISGEKMTSPEGATARWNTRAAIAAVGDEWRTIESCPRDGTWFLAREDDGSHYAASWVQEGEEFGDGYWMSRCGQYVTQTPEPTYWRPLPKAPDVTEDTK